MHKIPQSSITLLALCLYSLSVVELRIARPITYSFGDRLPKSTDLQISTAESKVKVIKHQPLVDIVASPQIIPKKIRAKKTTYTKKTSSPLTKQQVFHATYDGDTAKSEIQGISTKEQQIISPVIHHTEPVKKEYTKLELVKKDKLLQKPLTFSYNKDLKTAASNGNDHAVAESGNNQAVVNDDHDNNEPKEWSYKKGRGRNKHSGHYAIEGDKGLNNYDGEHEYEKEEKGHHDKEGHKDRYEDEAGNKKSHYYDDGLYGEYHKGEKGERGAKRPRKSPLLKNDRNQAKCNRVRCETQTTNFAVEYIPSSWSTARCRVSDTEFR
ncbi:hypothetical protein Trydic_g9812 [Trypoxylus dichotomus]